MFQIEIESSEDPIIDIVQTDPTAVFGRAYAGYILFLFGAADEEVATWFARRLIALDSLTGDDLACVIFARRVRVRSSVTRFEARRPWSGASAIKEGILLNTIRHTPAARLVLDGTVRWNPDEREITAVTYAADEVARRFGVVDRLPCLIFLEAIPWGSQGNAEVGKHVVYSLQESGRDDTIPFLRRVIQRFRESTAFSQYVQDVKRLAEIEARLETNRWKVESLKSDLEKQQKARNQHITKSLEALSSAPAQLRNGSYRLFCEALKGISFIDARVKAELEREAKEAYVLLGKLERTSLTLEWYALSPAGSLNTSRIESVIKSHAEPLLGQLPDTNGLSEQEKCSLIAKALRRLQDAKISLIQNHLPQKDLLQSECDKLYGASIACVEKELNSLGQLSRDLGLEQTRLVHHIVGPGHPSLLNAVSEVKDPLRSFESDGAVWDFFIAHASADEDSARELYNSLKRHSRVFLDKEVIRLGDNWDAEIAEAQKGSRVTLVLVSDRTETAYYQREEIAAAINMARQSDGVHRVIPIFIGSEDFNRVTIPYGLRLKHGVAVRGIQDLLKLVPALLELLRSP